MDTRKKYRRRIDDQVKQEPERGEPDHHRRNRAVELPQVSGGPKSQEEQCELENQWQRLHDDLEILILDPFSFLSRTLLLSAVDPRVSFCQYRLSHCFPSKARNDDKWVAHNVV